MGEVGYGFYTEKETVEYSEFESTFLRRAFFVGGYYRKELFMPKCNVNDEIFDYVSQSEFDEMVCEPSLFEDDFAHEDLSVLAEFGY